MSGGVGQGALYGYIVGVRKVDTIGSENDEDDD